MKKLISILFSLMLPLSFTSASKAGGHMEAEVIHWWVSGGEQAAISKFAEAWEGMGGTWIDTAITGGENARGTTVNRIIGHQTAGKSPQSRQHQLPQDLN